jgi:hypothetical protein
MRGMEAACDRTGRAGRDDGTPASCRGAATPVAEMTDSERISLSHGEPGLAHPAAAAYKPHNPTRKPDFSRIVQFVRVSQSADFRPLVGGGRGFGCFQGRVAQQEGSPLLGEGLDAHFFLPAAR